MENFKDWSTEVELETVRAENKIEEILPTEKLIQIFGDDTFLIGGCPRDVILSKNASNGDFDLMTRSPLEEVLERLDREGYARNESVKFSDKGYSLKDNSNVMNLSFHGKEIQVGFVGDTSIQALVSAGDVNLNCCAYHLGTKKIINPEVIPEILRGELKFCDPENAPKDPMKIISGLKQISRIPELFVPKETQEVISSSMPRVVAFFESNPDRLHKLQQIFGNINSGEIVTLFKENGGQKLLQKVNLKKEKLLVSTEYESCAIEDLSSDLKSKIVDLIKLQYGRGVQEDKIFNRKVNSVTYEIDEGGQLTSCCLVDGNRIYTVAALSADKIVDLVSDMGEQNYTIWATAAESNRGIIKLAIDAGLKPVNNAEVVKKILISNYPEYSGRVIVDIKGELTVFTKQDSEDSPQVLLLS